MEKKYDKWIFAFYILISHWWAILIGIALVSYMVPSCNPEDPVDYGKKECRWIRDLVVLDSTGNGFVVVTGTNSPISIDRQAEMQMRDGQWDLEEHVRDAADSLFGPSFLYVDIFDMGKLAAKYDTDSVQISEIQIYGEEKMKLYAQPSPDPLLLDSGIQVVSPYRQGMQYITGTDLYDYLKGGPKCYYYYLCSAVGSKTDERFTHYDKYTQR